MKKLIFSILFTVGSPLYAARLGSLSSNAQVALSTDSAHFPLPGNATNYIQNSATLQSGSTAYPSYLYVGTSGTINGNFSVTGVITASNTQITTSAGLLDATKITSTLNITSGTITTLNSSTAVVNNSFQAGGGSFSVGSTSVTVTSLPAYIRGTNTTDNARTGDYGEWISSHNVAAVNHSGSSTWDNYASISLTAGDWDVSGILEQATNSATVTEYWMSISSYSDVGTTDHQSGNNVVFFIDSAAITQNYFPLFIPSYRVTLSGTTTMYLKGFAVYSAGTPQLWSGRISARRMR